MVLGGKREAFIRDTGGLFEDEARTIFGKAKRSEAEMKRANLRYLSSKQPYQREIYLGLLARSQKPA